jgi:hypothetical protein
MGLSRAGWLGWESRSDALVDGSGALWHMAFLCIYEMLKDRRLYGVCRYDN